MKVKSIFFTTLVVINALVFWFQITAIPAEAGEPVWVEKCLRTECETDGVRCWVPVYY